MQKLIFFLTLIFLSVSVFSLGRKEAPIDAKNKIIVGLIVDQPGLGIGEASIYDSCYSGLQKAVNEGLITLRVMTSHNIEESNKIISNFVQDNVNLIFAIGDINKDLLIDAAILYNETVFVGVDILFSSPEIKDNLYGITFKEQDGGYLAGLFAGSLTYKYSNRHENLNETNRVGVILGKNTPEIKRYELGFYAGVKKVNPPCEIISVNINDLNSPEKGSNALIELKQKGVDIVFSIADESNIGVFETAEEENVFIIGANKDLSSISSAILTSVIKRISVSTYLMTKSYAQGLLTQGTNVTYGLTEGTISLAPYYKYDKYIPKDLNKLIRKMTKTLIKKPSIIAPSISEIIFDPEKLPSIEE